MHFKHISVGFLSLFLPLHDGRQNASVSVRSGVAKRVRAFNCVSNRVDFRTVPRLQTTKVAKKLLSLAAWVSTKKLKKKNHSPNSSWPVKAFDMSIFRMFVACSRIFNSEAQRVFFKSNHVAHRPGCLPLIQNVNVRERACVCVWMCVHLSVLFFVAFRMDFIYMVFLHFSWRRKKEETRKE